MTKFNTNPKIHNVMRNFTKRYAKIGIDLGTANLLVYVEGEGIIFNEPSVVAYDYETGEVLAVGYNAAKMVGKQHRGIKVVSPLSQGVVSDMPAAMTMIEIALKKAENNDINLNTATCLICMPSEVTQIERDAMIDLPRKLGVPDVFIEEEIKAGGIGAGLDIYSSNGSMIIDIGGGTTDIGVLSLGDVVVSESVRMAGNYFDNAIMNYVQYNYGLLIGKQTAKRVKEEICSLRDHFEDEKKTYANGRDVLSGLPRQIILRQSEIRDIIRPFFLTISNSILKALQETPAELSSDIIENGMWLNGGGALIDGISEFFTKHIGLKTRVSPNPLTAIAEGTKVLLQNRGSYLVRPTE